MFTQLTIRERNRISVVGDGIEALAFLRREGQYANAPQCSCYVATPVDLPRFLEVVRAIEDFWLCVVQLPPR
ncbi:MAG: hypothetical protein FJW14_01030 [Acidimicrobiia bacterium]|nr:hypothetical protein [Acidimicrobiia bacterium]